MGKLLITAKTYYWASIVMSLVVVYNLVKRDFIAVGIFLILSALLIAIGLIISRNHSNQG
ncbi:hypothetical protein [Colwellia piezophila]|uniref:hypothetical protein n=1 Tax=Colwellia piezophila TaxID=211668 RepID=UPI00037155B9|nr:hypothetical protein [Colwellia piezophila]